MTIRTPDDEIDRPGFFYSPFREGWTYHGATYGGHSPYSVDWNRRSPSGAWMQDEGDPVFASADGTVADVVKADGLVVLNHWGGEYRSEYRHMRNIAVQQGDKVQRGDKLGEIGNVAGTGSSFGPHLHVNHLRRGADGQYRRIPVRYEDKRIVSSVGDSDTKPKTWDAPGPVAVVGPPPKATWESAAKEAIAALEKTTEKLAAQKAQTELATDERNIARQQLAQAKSFGEQLQKTLQGVSDERDAARAAEQLAKDAADGLRTELTAAQAALKACQEQPTPDCTTAVDAERKRVAAAISDRIDQVIAEVAA
jgi:hypothetical protein